MTKHFVANSLNRIIDRAIQVHGALGYSTTRRWPRCSNTLAGRASPRRRRDPPDEDRGADHCRLQRQWFHVGGDG